MTLLPYKEYLYLTKFISRFSYKSDIQVYSGHVKTFLPLISLSLLGRKMYVQAQLQENGCILSNVEDILLSNVEDIYLICCSDMGTLIC